MIVKDESAVIERCLRSVRDLISYWVICDTGSTDGTQQLISEALQELPGELHERPWVDFGHNRTEALELARGKADYLLLLDADWTFSTQPDALEALTADAYLVQYRHAHDESLEFQNRNLVRGDRRWRYVGAVHEYLETDGSHTVERLQGAYITNWTDSHGGRKARFERDAELLEAALQDEPDHPRHLFYLAQTYRDLDEPERAVGLYRRRIELGGWDEEIFYSRYQVGVLLAQMGEWAAAVPALLDAWNYRSTRIEPLYQLALGYRRRQEHQAAFLFSLRALDRPRPTDILFIEPWIYRWGALFEYSVASFHVGDVRSSLDACERLLRMDGLPDRYREHTLANREHCRVALGRKPAQPPAQQTSFTAGDKRVLVARPDSRP